MRTLVHRRAATVAAALVTLFPVLPAAGAHADEGVVRDQRGDGLGGRGRDGDMASLRIRHGSGAVSFVVTPAPGSHGVHFYDFWIDTDGDPAPEHRATVSLELHRRVFVDRVDAFGQVTGRQVCDRRGTRYDFDSGVLRTRFPRWCLGRPERLRVSLQASQEYGTADWVPGARRFSRWVGRG